MKNSDFKRTIGIAFVALSIVTKVFSAGEPLLDFFQGAFIGLGLTFLVMGFIHARKNARGGLRAS